MTVLCKLFIFLSAGVYFYLSHFENIRRNFFQCTAINSFGISRKLTASSQVHKIGLLNVDEPSLFSESMFNLRELYVYTSFQLFVLFYFYFVCSLGIYFFFILLFRSYFFFYLIQLFFCGFRSLE